MKGTILENKKINDTYYYMSIYCPEFVKEAKVGQFLMIKAQQENYISDPLLRRPFGIADIDIDKGIFKILYMIIGKGTKLIANLKENSTIEFSKPLGNGFEITQNKNVAIVAGGVGIAPLLLLTKELYNKNKSIDLFFGGRNSQDIVILEEFKGFTDNNFITTNDGSLGEEALVTEPLERNINNYDVIYACGPKKMLKATSELAIKNNIEIQVSLDERMACGIGVCLGCIVYIKENGEEVQKRCCVEGPVFDGKLVNWDKY